MEVAINYSNYKCMRIKKFMKHLLKYLLNFFSYNKIKYEGHDGVYNYIYQIFCYYSFVFYQILIHKCLEVLNSFQYHKAN